MHPNLTRLLQENHMADAIGPSKKEERSKSTVPVDQDLDTSAKATEDPRCGWCCTRRAQAPSHERCPSDSQEHIALHECILQGLVRGVLVQR